MKKKALVLLAFLLLPFAAAADDLERTLLLVARPDLEGAYRHTALVVMPAGENRHIGFILNRASPMKLASAPLYYGGPQMLGAIFAMVRRDPGEPSLHLFGDVWVTGDKRNIDRLLEEAPARARFFVGFVGWEPDELAQEIEAGYWYVADPETAQVFSQEPGETLWSELVKRVGARKLQVRAD